MMVSVVAILISAIVATPAFRALEARTHRGAPP
jgi:hypothetical protein